MIVPQLAAGAAPELDDLRRSCDAAVARLRAARPDLVAGRVALLAMGDGSACRDLKAPGYLDPRAKEYDGAVVKALAAADPAALLALDPALSAELMVAGRAPWQVLAGAAAGAPMRGEVLYDAAPYGVQYTVAVWEPA
jgi:aromatic ring-opening dioxygenase LigB subunit